MAQYPTGIDPASLPDIAHYRSHRIHSDVVRNPVLLRRAAASLLAAWALPLRWVEKISFVRDMYTFNYPSPPSELVDAFRKYYGPTMNAFEAAEKNGRAGDLQKELEALFNSQNKSPNKGATSIPATFLRVTVSPD
jgi:hypothetical protein